MIELNERQLQVLKAIIDEYIETAEAVGSETLDKKYNLGVSPATIRNEMVNLTKMGLLKQPYTSAGRTPTPVAMKLYVEKLMKPKELSVADEVTVKQKIWDSRSEMKKLLKEATKTLAQQTKTMSLAATEEGDIFAAGVGNILDMPEFYDIDMTKGLLETLDEYSYWWQIISHMLEGTDPIGILLGDDLERSLLSGCGGVFVKFISPHHRGAIGVVGPARLNYPRIVPVVRYMGTLINDISIDW